MTWGAIGGAAVATVGGALMNKGSGGSNSGAQAAQGASAQSWEDIQKANELNRQNALWSQQQNQAAIDKAYQGSSTGPWGTTGRVQNAQGGWETKTALNSADQAIVDAIRQKQAGGAGNLDTSGGFNVNSDYMRAYQAQQEPALAQARDTENARLAAMGLGTGSGAAWGTAQDALNRSANDAGQKAILAGHDAWTADQGTLRSNLGALNSTESAKAGLVPNTINTGQAAQMGQITANAPTNNYYSGAMSDAASSAANNALLAKGLGAATTTAIDSDWWKNLGTNPASPAPTYSI